MKKVSISVGDFAIPSPIKGSIESNSGLGGSKEEGIELHQFIQQERKKTIPTYQFEVTLAHDFEYKGYLIHVVGRVDGLVEDTNPLIEEIKSTFNIWELAKILRSNREHPYCLQLLTYGYLYYLKTQKKPDLNLILVSSRNKEELSLEMNLSLSVFEKWLERRLEDIYQEILRAEKRTKRRQELEKNLVFPFPSPRAGQVELIEKIQAGLSLKKIQMVQAPTGLGKTIGVLYPSLKDALARGQSVHYVTPKNSQHSVAEDALDRLEEKGSKIKSLTITAKSKLCLKAEPLCNPEYCEFARDYYDKLATHEIKDQLSKKRKLTSRVFKNLAEKYEVCPFELQAEACEEADVIICDYNYVFGNKSILGRNQGIKINVLGESNLVIDEAHNLPSRGMAYYSPSLSSQILLKIKEEGKHLPKKMQKEFCSLIDEMVKVVKDSAPATRRAIQLKLDLYPFLEANEDSRRFLSKYLESDVEIRPRDPVLKLSFYWGEFVDVLQQIIDQDRPEFFFTYHPDNSGGTVKITCCDAGEMLKTRYKSYENVVLFSATLKPFEYYVNLSGLKNQNLEIAEFESPFKKENRKVLIIPQVSTKYSERERNYQKIADAISKICSLKKGNYIAFFSSFDFLEKVMQRFVLPAGFDILKQNRHMSSADLEAIFEKLKSYLPHVVFAVQGGVLSEGVDFPGEMLIGAFIIGPPLPTFDVERETMKSFYQTTYQQGFEYAYTYPAMAKSIQAAGRVIRTEKDKGIIVLMDSRFVEGQYGQSMPTDWFINTPTELVSSSILSDLQEFWLI